VNAVLRREGAEVLNLGPSDGYPPLKEALLEMLHHDGIAAKDENLPHHRWMPAVPST